MERISLAPMMDITDRHHRFMVRQISNRIRLFTEMVTTGALLHGDADSLLRFDEVEHPVALQLGGDDPVALAACARRAADLGYDEINLNVGCPSPRVQRGSFGASLMTRPQVVADAVAAMRAAVSVPVTVKHRIGVDDVDRYEDMLHFVDVVSAAGCEVFYVHARKAWLSGLSPKDNRTVPPLRYAEVERLKAERPHLAIHLNGGLQSVEEIVAPLSWADGVMVGRAFAGDPMRIAAVEVALGGTPRCVDPMDVAESLIPWVERVQAEEGRGMMAMRHALELLTGRPGARRWRRSLTEGDRQDPAGMLRAAIEAQRARGGLEGAA